MITNLPQPKLPSASQNQVSPLKPWAVALLIEDADAAKKLRILSATFGKKPGPYLTQVITEWLETINIDELQQRELPIDKAG